MDAFIADQIAGIGVGIGIAVAFYLVLLLAFSIADVIADWHETTLNNPDAHRATTPNVELYDSPPTNDLPAVSGDARVTGQDGRQVAPLFPGGGF